MVSNKGIYSSRSFWPLLGAITVATRETKAGPVSAYAHRGPTFDLASLNHIKPRQYRLAMPKPRTRLECFSKGTVCRRRLLLFLLAGLLLCLLRFLSHVALRDSKVGSMQVDLDMHKHRVHHNYKIDTARFEEGKRRSHYSALRVDDLSQDASARYVDTACRPARRHPYRN
jgi:hypothetical protein